MAAEVAELVSLVDAGADGVDLGLDVVVDEDGGSEEVDDGGLEGGGGGVYGDKDFFHLA